MYKGLSQGDKFKRVESTSFKFIVCFHFSQYKYMNMQSWKQVEMRMQSKNVKYATDGTQYVT